MILRGIDFGRVWGASGVQGFFGEGYWFHPYLKPIGLNFNRATFVAKTTTLLPNAGNMILEKNFTPHAYFPDCVVVKPFRGIALNAVGLSGPGAKALFQTRRWKVRRDPFFISFMAIAKTPEERLEELQRFVELFMGYLPELTWRIGLQLNYSCPNTNHNLEELCQEISNGLDIAGKLSIPLVPKLNALVPIEAAREISLHPNCDGLCVSNTIPYGQLARQVPWEKIFGPQSPLKQYGGGGLSGKPILPILLNWLRQAKSKLGVPKPINACGGILSLSDAIEVLNMGADSISLGSIAFLRPWRVKRIISDVNGD